MALAVGARALLVRLRRQRRRDARRARELLAEWDEVLRGDGDLEVTRLRVHDFLAEIARR